jgi:hypothetical protein
MELREYLIEMYLKHGEREFAMTHPERITLSELYDIIVKGRAKSKYITIRHTKDHIYMYTLTPAATKLIKEGTE